jgi:hypothetical protein
MTTLSQCQKVFECEGFLSNDNGGSPYRHVSHIINCNPVKLIGKLNKYAYFYDKERLNTLLDAGVKLMEDKDIVLNEFTKKIVPSVDDLYKFVKQDWQWHYVEYAK